jgi:hypothetical protein
LASSVAGDLSLCTLNGKNRDSKNFFQNQFSPKFHLSQGGKGSLSKIAVKAVSKIATHLPIYAFGEMLRYGADKLMARLKKACQ